MGCDIHAFVEYKNPNHSEEHEWSGWGGEFRLGRYYAIFAAMAGVRNDGPPPKYPPRGLPPKVNWKIQEARVEHTPSWLTADEFEEVTLGVPHFTGEYRAVLAGMRSLEKSGFKVRLVFWFDS